MTILGRLHDEKDAFCTLLHDLVNNVPYREHLLVMGKIRP